MGITIKLQIPLSLFGQMGFADKQERRNRERKSFLLFSPRLRQAVGELVMESRNATQILEFKWKWNDPQRNTIFVRVRLLMEVSSGYLRFGRFS